MKCLTLFLEEQGEFTMSTSCICLFMAYFPNGLFISLVFMSVLSGRNAVPEYFSSNYNYVRPLKHDF